MVLAYLLAKYIPKNELGEYFFFYTLAVTISGLLSAPLGMWITRSKGKGQYHTESIKQVWVLFSIALLILAIVVSFVTLVLPGFSLAISSMLMLAALSTYYWNSIQKKILFSFGIIVQPVFRTLFLLAVILYFGKLDSNSLLATNLLAIIFSLIITWMVGSWLNVSPLPRKKLNYNNIIKVLPDGAPLILSMLSSSFIFTAYQFSDKIIVKNIVGYDGVAELMLLMQWSYSIATLGLQPFITLIYPSILQSDRKESRRLIFKYSLFILVITVFFTSISVFLSGFILVVIPDNYSNIINYLWIGFLSGGLFMIGQVISIWFSKKANEKFHFKTVLIASVISIPVIYFFTIYYGVGGVMFGHLFFSVLYLLLCVYFYIGDQRNVY